MYGEERNVLSNAMKQTVWFDYRPAGCQLHQSTLTSIPTIYIYILPCEILWNSFDNNSPL